VNTPPPDITNTNTTNTTDTNPTETTETTDRHTYHPPEENRQSEPIVFKEPAQGRDMQDGGMHGEGNRNRAHANAILNAVRQRLQSAHCPGDDLNGGNRTSENDRTLPTHHASNDHDHDHEYDYDSVTTDADGIGRGDEGNVRSFAIWDPYARTQSFQAHPPDRKNGRAITNHFGGLWAEPSPSDHKL